MCWRVSLLASRHEATAIVAILAVVAIATGWNASLLYRRMGPRMIDICPRYWHIAQLFDNVIGRCVTVVVVVVLLLLSSGIENDGNWAR